MRDSEQFAAWAQQLIDDPAALTVAAWPRAAAFLGRSALEAAVAELWAQREPGIAGASSRAQLLCLAGYIDNHLATDIAYAHAALSAACHHHPYDLPPTAPEIQRWLAIVDELLESLRAGAEAGEAG